MSGHWALHGFGMFAVEEKSSGKYVGRVGPWSPPGWPGFEVGWGIAREFRGKGYAVEAARASIDWAFATFEIDEIIHCIDPDNAPSQAVARKLGASKGREGRIVRQAADIWVTSAKPGRIKIEPDRDLHQKQRALLPSQLRGLGDAIESLQREDRIRELVGAAVQHRAGERQEFLLHRLRIRE